jgi:3-oxoacyl-[acyl-carrier-protein] synthase III
VADIVVSYLVVMERPSGKRDPPDAVKQFISRRKLRATYFLSGDGATAVLVEINRS